MVVEVGADEVGNAEGMLDSSRDIVVWLRWCCSSLEANSGEEGLPVSTLDGANVAKILVRVIVEELADVVLDPCEMYSLKVDRTYVVVDGLHIAPKCTSCPPGPHPTRKDRPIARPASTYAPSLSFAMEDVIPTRAYFRVGLNIRGSTPWPKEARFEKEIRVDKESLR